MRVVPWIKDSFSSSESPVTLRLDGQTMAEIRSRMTLAERALSVDEMALLRELLMRGNHQKFLGQLESAVVIGTCSCGCPTIDIAVPDHVATTDAPQILVDVLGEVDGRLVGVLVFQARGLLTGLEVYDLAGLDGKFGLPALDSIRSFENGELSRNNGP